MTKFYAIEMYSDWDVDPKTLETKRVSPTWTRLKAGVDTEGRMRYLRFESIEEASHMASGIAMTDANIREKAHVNPVRVVEVENGLGHTIWLDPRPAALKILKEMHAPLPQKFRERLENL